MTSVVISITGAIVGIPGTLVDIFWNVNTKGLASGAVNESTRINDSDLVLFPASLPNFPQWLAGAWLGQPWLSPLLNANLSFETPLIYFGNLLVAAKTKDTLGNLQSDPINTTTFFVNSPPFPAERFRRGAYTGGQLAFTFTQSKQVEI